jgi:hypothetical protein
LQFWRWQANGKRLDSLGRFQGIGAAASRLSEMDVLADVMMLLAVLDAVANAAGARARLFATQPAFFCDTLLDRTSKLGEVRRKCRMSLST